MKKIFTILFLFCSVVMASPVKAQVPPPPVAPPPPPIPEPQPEEPQKIPEPSSIAGILALGVLGATSLRRRQTKLGGKLSQRT